MEETKKKTKTNDDKKAKEKEKEKDKVPKPEPKGKIVLITGANRGLGYTIIDSLLEKKTKLRIILTARNDELGQNAYNELCEKYPDEKEQIFYHQLDITNEESITELIGWIKKTFKKIDYIVNNAGVSSKGLEINEDVFNFTFNTNVFGTIMFTEKMMQGETLNKSGKLIFIGSAGGNLSKLKNETLISNFKNAKTTDDLYRLSDKFKNSIINETIEEDGWCKNTYAVSQMIINTYARVLSNKREITKEQTAVYVCNPGWIKTEMGGEHAMIEVKDGALTPIYLIELPDGINKEFQGKYFSESKLASFD